MGYILPIQQHEYADYQRRMITQRRTITSIEKSYRAVFDTNYEELRREDELRSQKLAPTFSQTEEPTRVDLDDLYTEITGLGIYINEQV
ncbi:hypothetical protein [Ornithinibacillus contaminans]|uniref:hypothetical protein n=1 Tax=Ornithinibacillus contaminans TaxID=694055 RepID=UPI00064D8ACA|nr:hypothetical protein [Ornithinibacillus contaminans]